MLQFFSQKFLMYNKSFAFEKFVQKKMYKQKIVIINSKYVYLKKMVIRFMRKIFLPIFGLFLQ